MREIVYRKNGLRMFKNVVYEDNEDNDAGRWLAVVGRDHEPRYNPARHFTMEDCNKISEFVKECEAASNDIEETDAKPPRSYPDTQDTTYDMLWSLVSPLISALLVPAAPMYRGAYHSKRHVEEMLRIALGRRSEIAASCPCFKNMYAWSELFNAIVWHDAHANLKEPFNELNAARVYASYCRSASGEQYDDCMDRDSNQRVVDDILSTRFGYQEYKTDVQRVLHDLDWYCFSNVHRLRLAEDRIFEEYQQQGLGTEAQAVEARRRFYGEILASKQPIFVSAWMKDRNDDAITLIQERIEYLAGGHDVSEAPDSVFP
jgi:hypothetical protein